jgi:hypothetical protein
MSDISDLASRSEIVALATRIRELEAQLVRMPVNTLPQRGAGTDDCTRCKTDNCTDCGTGKCTHCAGDEFQMVILPGELERLSGAQLVKRLQAGRTEK